MTAPALESLVARMPLLALAQHPLGLPAARATEFSGRVQAGGDVALALAQTGGDRRLASMLTRAKPSDAVAVLLRLLPTVGEVATLRRALKSAGAYPLTLVASFALACWVIYTVSLPALASLGADPSSARLEELAIIGGCLGLLVGLAIVTGGGLRVPGFARGHALLDRVLALEIAAALVEGGVGLPDALAAAAEGSRDPIRSAARELARAFAAGVPPPRVEPLLDQTGAAILAAGAQRGVAAAILQALATQYLLEAQRRIPEEARRVQLIALLLAGAALLALAAGWYQQYLHAVIR